MKYGKFVDAEGNIAFKLNFLAQALDSDDTGRVHLKYIYIKPAGKDGCLLATATNGRHLHSVVFTANEAEYYSIKPGYWRVLMTNEDRVWITRLENKETKDFVYPAWQKVIPMKQPEYETTFSGFTLSTTDEEKSNHQNLAEFFHNFPSLIALNLGYLHALGSRHEWKVEWYGKNSVLKFSCGDFLALIMPIFTGEV